MSRTALLYALTFQPHLVSVTMILPTHTSWGLRMAGWWFIPRGRCRWCWRSPSPRGMSMVALCHPFLQIASPSKCHITVTSCTRSWKELHTSFPTLPHSSLPCLASVQGRLQASSRSHHPLMEFHWLLLAILFRHFSVRYHAVNVLIIHSQSLYTRRRSSCMTQTQRRAVRVALLTTAAKKMLTNTMALNTTTISMAILMITNMNAMLTYFE